MRPSTPPLALIALLPPVALSFPTCGGGGGGGGSHAAVLEIEPNDSIGQANRLVLGTPSKGDVTTLGDVDWFQTRLARGRTIKIELFGTRLDQATWDAAGTVPRLTVYFPNDATKILEHSFTSGWSFGAQDFDIPLFRVPTNGTYWFVVKPDDDLATGGRYALRVTYVRPPPSQFELEQPLDTGVDDTPGTAQTIGSGTLSGFHRDGNDDFYAISVPGPRVLRVEIVGQRNGAWEGATSTYDPLLRLFGVDGATLLAENDDAFFADPAIQYEVAAAGTYFIQVTQNPASSVDGPYFLTLSADSAAATAESEPNDSLATADPIAYGQAVSGSIAPGEEDWFRFSGSPGDMVRLQVFDSTISQASSSPVDVALLAADGLTPVPFHEGRVFQVLTTILQQTGTFHIRVRPDPAAVAATSYRLELKRFHSAPYETEPNDTIATANAFPGGKFAAGVISIPGDLDLFRFVAGNGELVTFVVYADDTATGSDGFSEYSGHGSDLDPLLVIRDSTGAVLATSTSVPPGSVYTESVADGLPTAALTFVGPPTSHTFYLEVTSADGSGGSGHYYVVERR
jgi:hypothetical protein